MPQGPSRGLALLSIVGGCVPIEPEGSPFAPVPVRVPPPPRAQAEPGPTPPDPDDVFADDREESPGPAPGERPPSEAPATDVLALQARNLAAAPTPAEAAPAVSPTPAPVWDPTIPVPDAGFGVRVVAVLLDLQPPRAILGLPDGREQVVTAGAMVPEQGLVVLAIGRDAVQIAKITPNGYSAVVDTETVRVLFPAAPPAP
jgi:hypothetical protein